MTSYERGKDAGEAVVQFELWAVEREWKEDRQRLIAEREAWRERAEKVAEKLFEMRAEEMVA